MKPLVVLLIAATLFTTACKKDSFITSGDARISLSADSLYFDTLFTSTGSVTQFFRLYNENDQKLRISSIELAGGSSSYFKINVDGFTGPVVNDLEMEANDSLYVYVAVRIDPSTGTLPFIAEDSIRISFNGNERLVKLSAWGQDAHFMQSTVITGNTTWTNDKPYVILGGLQVDQGASLTIEKGCHIYAHADAPILIDGTLKVLGEAYDSTRVVFKGDRLDDPYRDYPAGWPGIYFRETSTNNVLQYAEILNAYQGIVAVNAPSGSTPQLQLDACIIDNCYDAGIYGLASYIKAQNCLISNCGQNLVLAYGGLYDFTHCTSVAYSNSYLLHTDPALLVADYVKQDNTILTNDLQASFTNCIFWGENGTVEDEVVALQQGSGVYQVSFDHCLWKVTTAPTGVTTNGILTNLSPLFENTNTQNGAYNFRLASGSPAIDQGSSTGLSTDLDGNNRNVGVPDLGCYENQQ